MPLYMHNFYGQAESGGSLLKIDLCTLLCSKKTFNFESFEFPSWEFKNIFWGVYPHQTRAPCTICIPPNRKGHIDPSFPQGGLDSKGQKCSNPVTGLNLPAKVGSFIA